MQDRFFPRFWSVKEKRYIYADCYMQTAFNRSAKENEFGLLYKLFSNPVDFVLEQCTGSKDKKGNLIYEGDIVKVEDGEWVMYSNRVFAVEYDYALCGFGPFCEYDSDMGFYNYSDDCVVIGNVHENENLLED